MTQSATLTPRGFALLLAVTFSVVGAFVASREPRNAVGWIFAVAGVSMAVQYGAEQVAYLASESASPLLGPAAIVVFILGATNSLATGISLLYLFPTGHFLDRRDRVFAIAGIAFSAVAVVATTMITERLPVPWAGIANPFAQQGTGLALAFPGAGLLVLIGSTAMGVRALVRRFRHSTGVERQQLKWFVFAGTIVGVTLALTYVVLGYAFYTASGEASFFPEPPLLVRLTVLLNIASFVLIPPALAIAILRYRLYDIDVLINRTLVYGATTAGIATVFFVGIVVLQALLRPITGGSEIAVAASTLLSVAIAQPLRARMQGAVDRRFFRSRYDAAHALDAFSARLRDEVALDAVRADLLDAVRDTVQPAHVGVWLRDRS